MTSIDERIRKELESEAKEIDAMVRTEESLPGMMLNSYKGGMRHWVVMVNIVTFIITIFMFWSIYEFWIATTNDDRTFWGLIAIASSLGQGMLKMWHFNEMNRQSIIREIKRVELAIAKLEAKLSG
jgi:hypothetical protein